MFPAWRLKLREAQLAFQGGRYDDARRLLEGEEVRDFLPAKELARKVAAKFVERAGDRFSLGQSSAGWNDLTTADRLGGQDAAVAQMRNDYLERTRSATLQYLVAGQPATARKCLAKLARRGLLGKVDRDYQMIATLWCQAEKDEANGHFADALVAIQKAKGLAEQPCHQDTMDLQRSLADTADRLKESESKCNGLTTELHGALAREDWGAALAAADAILALAPQHHTARQARRKAWNAVGMDSTHLWRPLPRPARPVSLWMDPKARQLARRATPPVIKSSESDTVAGYNDPRRLLLWVDAVGGFLVCLDDAVLLGQPTHGTPIAVPILADLSRRHAVIRRDGGAYVLEPVHKVYVDGRQLHGPTVLADKQLVQLGDSVRLRFAKPHALSATARLTIESHHKTQPSADGVLLMAESCVMGPKPHSHIQCADWHDDVILYRQGDGLRCRAGGILRVDEEPIQGPVDIGPGSRVEGEDFSLSLEEVE